MRRSKAAPQHEFFPGFTDIAEIGVGSLATVFRAREIGTNRLVALKLLNVRDASPRALESFERESVALGAVSSHPNIVTLYRTFRAADQRPVLVLELCHGSIADRMPTDAGLPVAEVVALGIKIAGALETAHRAEILHRDVKPQNILITEFGEPALADFGVAMLQSSTQTTAGLFDFTTLHAAPELLEGGATSAATDVYELASTLYQLIAGRAAFRAYEGESPASVILRILRDPVQPLVNSQAPPSLSDLLLHAMSKDQGSRPPTAAEFAAGLAGVEVEYGWPRTQFLIRDIGGGTSGLPTYTRLPDAGQQAAPDFAAPASAAPPVPPAEPAQAVPEDDWSTPTVSGRPVEHPPAPAMDPRPTNERVLPDPAELGPVVAPFDEFVDDAVVDEPVDEAGVDEPVDEAAASTESDGWSEVHLVQAHVEPPSDSGDPSDLVEPVAAAEPATSTGVAAAAAWEPPPPPDVVDAEVPRPANPDTREVKLANREALLAAPAAAQADRLEAERVEAERVEAERVEAERVEAERVEAERVEAERVEAERLEAERLEAERVEAERVEAERVEQERVEAERVEAERVEAERVEAERVEAERVEAERVEAERVEAERVEAERVEAERVEAERLEAERLEAERAEAERAEAERVEAERVEAERAEAERVDAERVEVERVEAERVEAERRAAEAATSTAAMPVAPHDDRDDASSGDLASIWGAVETVTPPPPPPPDPSTRIDGPAPAAATFSQTPDEVAPADPYDNTDSDTLLPHVPWRGAVAEPHPFDTDEHRLDPADRSAIVEGGRPYPIPPAGAPDDRPPKMEVSTGTVPTWAFRAATQTPSGPFSYGDLALDPQSLRNKVTLRAGTASLSVDDSGLLVRMRMRRTSIPWHDVMGFEPRFDDDGGGRLAVLTQSGPVELAATRRPAGEVRYIHALLEAYRQRAALSGRS